VDEPTGKKKAKIFFYYDLGLEKGKNCRLYLNR
jgi:hypothetical protein